MSEPLFAPLPSYAKRPPPAGPPAGPYVDVTPPPGAWPSRFGGPAQTSRASEPLVSDRWALAWEAPLGDAARPDGLLVSGDAVVVDGERARGIWDRQGQARGQLGRGRGGGAALVVAPGGPLLADDPEGGLFTHTLHTPPTGARDARIMLAASHQHVTRCLVPAPGGAVAWLAVHDSPFGPPANAIVEVAAVRDWGRKSAIGVLSAIEPLAGIVRHADGQVEMAATTAGPVLATPDGILWCDWLLRPRAEQRWDYRPWALSADEHGRAFLLASDEGEARLVIATPDGAPPRVQALPWAPGDLATPPLVAPHGRIYLTPPGHVVAMDAEGHTLWRQQRAAHPAPGALTANGMLLVSDADWLFVVTPDGARHPLWRFPAPPCTAPVLAQGRIHVASAETLYVLEATTT